MLSFPAGPYLQILNLKIVLKRHLGGGDVCILDTE